MLLCLAVTNAVAVPLTLSDTFQHLSKQDGLTELDVTAIAEDKRGVLWFATLNGLNRFDGYRFTSFHPQPDKNSLAFNMLFRLVYVEANDSLYIASQSNLERYDIQQQTFSTLMLPHGAKPNHLSFDDKYLWVASDKGLISVDLETDQVEVQQQSENLIRYMPTSMGGFAINSAGQVLPIGNSQLPEPFTLVEGPLVDLKIINQQFYALTQTALTQVDSVTAVTLLEGENFGQINHQPGSDKLYITHGHQVTQLSITDALPPRVIETSRSLLPITRTYEDKHGNLWLAVRGEGLYVRANSNNSVKKYTNPDLNSVWGLHEFNGLLVLLTDTPEIHFYDESMTWQRSVNTGISGPKAVASHAGKLLVSGHNGVTVIDANYNSTSLHYEAAFSSIIPDPYSNRLFLGTVDHGLMELKEFDTNPRIVKVPFKERIQAPILNGLATRTGLFIGTQNGVHQITKLKQQLIRNGTFLEGVIINGIKASRGRIFLQNFEGGLYRYHSLGQVESLTDLYNTASYSFEVTDDYLITATANGVVVINNETGKLERLYTQKQGAMAEFFGLASGRYQDKMLFGGKYGFNVVGKNHDFQYQLSAPLIFDFNLFNKAVKPGNVLPENIISAKQIFLNYSDYPFSFKFSSPADALSHDLSYLYRLKGLDENWMESPDEQRQATYTNVPHGSYVFQVKTIDETGIESPITEVQINIRPPWWLTDMAKACAGLILLLLSVLIYRNYQQRLLVQRRIAKSEERLKLSLWGSGDEMWDWDIVGGRVYRSNVLGELDFPQDGCRNVHTTDSNIHPGDLERVSHAIAEHLNGNVDHFEATYRVKDNNGNWVWLLDRAKIVEYQDEKPTRMTGTIKDISLIKATEERLNIFAQALKNISEGMFILDENFNYIELNDSATHLLGSHKNELIGQPFKLGNLEQSHQEDIANIVSKQGRWTSEIDYRRLDGRHLHLDVSIDLINSDKNNPSYFVGIIADITHRKNNELELRRLTNNDVLTGLPNRTYLQTRLEARITNNQPFCLLVFDLDNFKRINDTLGHDCGDTLLCHVAQRLNSSLTGNVEAYRIGGDEFAVIAEVRNSSAIAATIGSKILRIFDQPFLLGNEEIVINGSIGIVSFPDDDNDTNTLLRKADLAMYHAKSLGGQRFSFFNDSMNEDALKRFETESMIRQALREEWFELYYQPKLHLETNLICGMEALIRLNHPEKGTLSPFHFIKLAEDTGLIVELDDWVLRKACQTAAHWLDEGLEFDRIAVNLSSPQFTSETLCDRIESLLHHTGLPANKLELEITESTLIEQPEHAITIMNRLSALGVHLALDDFGTGYSSLAYLKRFPIHTLKVDKSFIDDIGHSERDLKMVDSIITIAHNMDLSVVAEGIETEQQLKKLSDLGCEMIQGYFFSKPLPTAKIKQALFKQKFKEKQD